MSHQSADTVLMVRPAAFGYNEQTAADNSFQKLLPGISLKELQEKAVKEFNTMVEQLRQKGIEVLVFEDTSLPVKTDALFPNNWFNTMPNGNLSVFPMLAINRRLEKRDDILQQLTSHYEVKGFTDWSELEAEGLFLEGTGSMVIDHDNQIIYACLSQRTHYSALEKFAHYNRYKAITFHATDENGTPVYHTNVMFTIGSDFEVICNECFADELEWIAVSQLLRTTGHRIISISQQQVKAFAGNMLQVKNNKGDSFLVMSQTAFDSLSTKQRMLLEISCTLLPVKIPTIETLGGGSARCMMAEIFLKKK